MTRQFVLRHVVGGLFTLETEVKGKIVENLVRLRTAEQAEDEKIRGSLALFVGDLKKFADTWGCRSISGVAAEEATLEDDGYEELFTR